MKKSSGKKYNKKVLQGILAAIYFAGTMSVAAYAANNATLSGLQINQNNDSFEIVLKTDKDLSVNRHITNKDKLVLDISGVIPSKAVNTIYNNTSDVDNVIFQPVSKDKMKIFLQGKNISDSKVSVDTNNFVPGIEENSKKVIELNKPINNYSPIVNINEDELVQNNLFSTFSLNKSNISWLLSFILLAITFFLSFKSLNLSKKKVNVSISSDDLKNREQELYKKLNKKDLNKNYEPIGLKGLNGLNERLTPESAPIKTPVNTPINTYGLKEYQNSQINPRVTKKVSTPISAPTAPPKRLTASDIQALLSSGKSAKKIKPVLKTPSTPAKVEMGATAKSSIDGMKFLESMAQIYEKSGRVDLAHGLQNNINKVKSVSNPIL